jgi:TolB-like protein
VVVLILLTTLILYFQQQQAGNTSEIGKDLKDVKEIVSGDAELKNMSSTDDLTATKDLNARTKDVNAKRVAIIYFENSSDDPSLNKLKKGLADMMITDLSNINMLNIVERDRLEAILKEQKLSKSSQVDPATAAKVGKLLGAQVILTGGYFEMMGSLRIDARFIDVETGKILKSDGVDGAASSFFKIQKQLSWKIIKNLDTKISDKEKADLSKLENSKNISLEDTKIYSEALDLYDNGKIEQAKTIFDKLITKYPDFQAAKNIRSKIK